MILETSMILWEGKQKTVEQQIQCLEEKYKRTNEIEDKMELKKKHKELDRIRTDEVERLMTYAKQEYDDGGSNSFKLLAYRLKKQSNTAHITQLKTGSGSETVTQK